MKIFGIHILSSAALAAVKVAAVSEVQHAVSLLKTTELGALIAADIRAAQDSTLTGARKFEQVVANTAPLVLAYAAKGGLAAVLADVESIARELVQSVFNDVASTKAVSFARALLKLFGVG